MPAVTRGLLASPLGRDWEMSAIPTYRPGSARRRHGAFLSGLLGLVRWACVRRPGIIHVHAAVRGSLHRKAIYVALGRLLGRPVLLHIHAGAGDIEDWVDSLDPVRRALFRLALRLPDRTVSVSAAGVEALARRLGATGVLVVPNAAPEVAGAAPSGPLTGGARPRVLYLGGFEDPAKGGALLLEALARVGEEVDVVLAGPGEAPGGVDARWRGWLDEQTKDSELRAADIVVFPSLSEGLPVALLEAMAHARAIVATRVGGMPEVLEDGVEAVFVPPRDPEALAAALRDLAADAERRAALGAAARARAGRLNDDEVCGRLDRLYRELLG